MPQCRARRDRISLASDDASLRGKCLDCRGANRFLNLGGFYRYDGTTTRFHRALEQFDRFIDPLIVVLVIGKGLFPECIRLMQASRSAVHAALPIRKVPPRLHP
jgi:hypothetical protein